MGLRGMPAERPVLLTTGQAARICAVTPDTILKWLKKGRLSGVRTAGGHYRIERRELERLAVLPCPAVGPSQPISGDLQGMRCWEYLSDRGAVRENCRQCVVFRVRASRCFLMAGLGSEVGHARQFCQSSCEDCVYYRRVRGVATNVLVVTSDDELAGRLTGEENKDMTLRFAHNAYEASAIISEFRPAFAVIDVECVPEGDAELVDSLATDPRVPGLKIIIVVPSGMTPWKRRRPKKNLVVSVLEKPCGSRPIAAVIDSYPVDSLAPEDSSL